MLRKPAYLKSPFIDTTANPFKCNKFVSNLYNTVCAFGGRTTRSTNTKKASEIRIIIYPILYVTLADLAASVKPKAMLTNTVAEAGLFAINRRARNAKKRVLPLRISTFLQSRQIERNEVTRVFKSAPNHLDHRDLVMFPVLHGG